VVKEKEQKKVLMPTQEGKHDAEEKEIHTTTEEDGRRWMMETWTKETSCTSDK
jgi:hypothetical protein